MAPVIESDVPAENVGNRVKIWMLNTPRPAKITVEKDATGKYTITIAFE
jgi:hypothetical protein